MKDIREVAPGVWSVLDGSRSFEVRIANGEVRVNGRGVQVTVEDPRTRRSGASGSAQLKAPMPGKVVRILVAAGDDVAIGQGLIVVEAMKMQNELKSPRDGKVVSVAVREHDTVNAGAVLLTIE